MQFYPYDLYCLPEDWKLLVLGLAPIISEYLAYPFDLLKTRTFVLGEKDAPSQFKRLLKTQNLHKGLKVGLARSLLALYPRFIVFELITEFNHPLSSPPSSSTSDLTSSSLASQPAALSDDPSSISPIPSSSVSSIESPSASSSSSYSWFSSAYISSLLDTVTASCSYMNSSNFTSTSSILPNFSPSTFFLSLTLLGSFVTTLTSNGLNSMKIKIQCSSIEGIKEKTDIIQNLKDFKGTTSPQKFLARLGRTSYLFSTTILHFNELFLFCFFKHQYDQLKIRASSSYKFEKRAESYPSTIEVMGLGAVAGLCAGFLVSPFEFINARIVTKGLTNLETPSFFKEAKASIEKNGLLGLWRGSLAAGMRGGIQNGILMGIFNEFVQRKGRKMTVNGN